MLGAQAALSGSKLTADKRAAIFQCVGVLGVLQQKAPRGARIAAPGVCIEAGTIEPFPGTQSSQ